MEDEKFKMEFVRSWAKQVLLVHNYVSNFMLSTTTTTKKPAKISILFNFDLTA